MVHSDDYLCTRLAWQSLARPTLQTSSVTHKARPFRLIRTPSGKNKVSLAKSNRMPTKFNKFILNLTCWPTWSPTHTLKIHTYQRFVQYNLNFRSPYRPVDIPFTPYALLVSALLDHASIKTRKRSVNDHIFSAAIKQYSEVCYIDLAHPLLLRVEQTTVGMIFAVSMCISGAREVQSSHSIH